MRIPDNSFYDKKTYKFINISELKIGDVFRAEIIDIKQNEMILKLLGTDSVISAKTNKMLGLKIGGLVNFKVNSNVNNQLVIEPVVAEDEPLENEAIHNAIKNNNLPDNQISVELVKKLFENSPIIKEKISNLYNLIKQNPKLDVDKLIVLLNNNIQVTEKNIDTLNSLVEGRVSINIEIDNIISNLNKDLIYEIIPIIDIVETAEADNKLNKSQIQNTKTFEEFENQINSEKPIEKLDSLLKLFNDIKKSDNTQLKEYVKEYIDKNIDTFKKLFHNKFKLDIDTDKNDINDINAVNEKLKSLYKFVAKLTQNLDNSDDANKIFNSATNIKNTIEFSEKLLRYDTYIQLPPIKYQNLETSPELYILRNKKKRSGSANSTALLCLDLVNLGYTEILINKASKNVSLKFRLTNDKAGAIINTNISKLKISLLNKGINVTSIAYEDIEQKSNLLNAKEILPSQDDDGRGKIYTFDIRV